MSSFSLHFTRQKNALIAARPVAQREAKEQSPKREFSSISYSFPSSLLQFEAILQQTKIRKKKTSWQRHSQMLMSY